MIAELTVGYVYCSVDVLRVAPPVSRHPAASSPVVPTVVGSRVLPECGFVFEQDYSTCLAALFFSAGYVLRTQRCWSSGSAKASFLPGRWTEKPRLWSIFLT